MTAHIATVTGRLTLTIGTAEIDLGRITIPINAYPDTHRVGEINLKTAVNPREVRDHVEAVFGQEVTR